jgi:hypothetical protein
MHIMFCCIGSVVACYTCLALDDALLTLSPCKFSSELSPSLVHCIAPLPFSANFRDSYYVKDEEEGNVNVLRLHVWLHVRICIADSIINLFEQCINRFL